MARKRIVAVDIGTSSVKVAEVAASASGLRVTRAGAADVESRAGGTDANIRALRHALSAAGVRRGPCLLSIPRHQVVTRRLRGLPAHLDGARLDAVVSNQAQADLPFGDTAVWSYYDVRASEAGTSVELVAGRRQLVDGAIALVREAGLRPDVVAPSVFGIATLARLHQQSTGTSKRVMILSVGGSNTDVIIMRGDYFAFSRSFPVGAVTFHEDATAASSRFRLELVRTVQAYQRDFIDNGASPVEEVWVWGGGATTTIPGPDQAHIPLTHVVEEELRAPARIWSDVSGFEDAEVLTSAGGWARFGVAVGLAAAEVRGELGVNLLPGEEKERKAQAAQNRRLVFAGLGVVALVALILLAGNGIRAKQARDLAEIDAQIRELEAERLASQRTLNTMRTMAELAKPRFSVLDILRELTAVLPNRQDVAVTVVNIEPSGKVTLSLEASSHDSVSNAVKGLGQSAWFTDARPGQITVVDKNGRQIRQLNVSIRLAEDADMLAVRRVGTPISEAPAVAQSGPDPGGPGGSGGPGGPGQLGGRGGPPPRMPGSPGGGPGFSPGGPPGAGFSPAGSSNAPAVQGRFRAQGAQETPVVERATFEGGGQRAVGIEADEAVPVDNIQRGDGSPRVEVIVGPPPSDGGGRGTGGR